MKIHWRLSVFRSALKKIGKEISTSRMPTKRIRKLTIKKKRGAIALSTKRCR